VVAQIGKYLGRGEKAWKRSNVVIGEEGGREPWEQIVQEGGFSKLTGKGEGESRWHGPAE